jgi:hypothetical protein
MNYFSRLTSIKLGKNLRSVPVQATGRIQHDQDWPERLRSRWRRGHTASPAMNSRRFMGLLLIALGSLPLKPLSRHRFMCGMEN